MPYEWLPPDKDGERLHLWPHRSLGPRGFVWFIAVTAGLIALPLLATLGQAVHWGLLPFVVAAVWAVWFAIRKNGRDRDIVEDLSLSPDRLTLVRHDPGGKRREWQGNPYWVRVSLYPTGGPVPHYLTLKSDGREVELGAFLSEEERIALKQDLSARLAALR